MYKRERDSKKIGSVLVGRRSSNHTTTTNNNNNSTVNTNNNQTKDPPLKYTEEELKELTPPKPNTRGPAALKSRPKPTKKVIRIIKKGNKIQFTNETEEEEQAREELERAQEAKERREKYLLEHPQISKSRWKNMDNEFYLKTAFGLLDRNQDGMVTANELQFMLRNLGIHVRDELIDDLMIQASENGNGLIDETEFLQWVAKIQAIREESQEPRTEPVDIDDDLTQDLIAAFRVFDRDGNGYITRDELQTAMDMIGEAVTEQQLNDLLTLADLDKDGKINYEEFARLLL